MVLWYENGNLDLMYISIFYVNDLISMKLKYRFQLYYFPTLNSTRYHSDNEATFHLMSAMKSTHFSNNLLRL